MFPFASYRASASRIAVSASCGRPRAAQDLAEGNAGRRVIVAPVGLPSEGDGAARKCLRILQATGGRQDLRPDRPPRDLCRKIVGRRRLLATVDERLRLVVTALPVENLRQERRQRGDKCLLAHLLEPPQAELEALLRPRQIAGKDLDQALVLRRPMKLSVTKPRSSSVRQAKSRSSRASSKRPIIAYRPASG